MFKLSDGAPFAIRLLTLLQALLLFTTISFASVACADMHADQSMDVKKTPAGEYKPQYIPYPGPDLTPKFGSDEANDPAAPSSQPSSQTLKAPTEGRIRAGLSSDLIYAVLVGEIASQRDKHDIAFKHYLYAARLARDSGMAELAARAALSLGQPEAAMRATDLWVELDASSSKAHQIAAYARIDAKDRAGTLAELNELIRLASDSEKGFLQAAQMLSRVADPEDRMQMMRELVAGDIDNADAQFALAMLAAGAEDINAAQKHAKRAIELRPDWDSPRLFLVRLLVADDQLDEAISAIDQFLAAEPENQEMLLLRTQLHIDAEEYDSALALFDDILERIPEQPELVLTAAVLALQVEALDKARNYLTLLRKMGAHADDSAFLLGQVEELAGETEQALDWYAKVRGENETNAHVRIAGIYLKRGETERAREILQQLRDQFPADVTALYLIEGELLSEQNLTQQAFDTYSDALSKTPDNADLLYARAMLAVEMDRVDLLERDLRRILVNDPDHVDALNALGYTLADRTDRLEEALSFIERALQLRPDEPAILDSMGWALFRKGDAESAEPFLRRALDSMFDAEIAAHLGEVLWALGRREDARKIWGRALAEDPKHEYLLRTLGRYRITQSGP